MSPPPPGSPPERARTRKLRGPPELVESGLTASGGRRMARTLHRTCAGRIAPRAPATDGCPHWAVVSPLCLHTLTTFVHILTRCTASVAASFTELPTGFSSLCHLHLQVRGGRPLVLHCQAAGVGSPRVMPHTWGWQLTSDDVVNSDAIDDPFLYRFILPAYG